MFRLIGFVCVAAVFLLPFRDGDSISDAARNEVVQQIPPALDVLAARHPLKVGLIRSLLNDRGQTDRFVQSYVRQSMDRQQKPGILDSYFIYYYVLFDKDEVRSKMADSMEKEFGLNADR